MRLRPLPVTRVANATPGLVLTAVGVALSLDVELAPWRWPLGVAAVVLGCYLAVRGPRAEVVCDSSNVRVRSLLRTRVVARAAVLEVSDWSALRWSDSSGRRRWTPLVMFAITPRMLRSAVHHHREQVKRLRRWVHLRR